MGKGPYRSVPARKKKPLLSREIEIPIPEVHAYSILAICFMVLYCWVICRIPHFGTDLYRAPHSQEQPISDLIIRWLPLSPPVVAGIAVGLFAIFIIVNRVDALIGLFLGICVILDPGSMSMLTVTTAVAVQSSLVLLGMIFATNTVSMRPFSPLWFVNLFFSWVATCGSVLMNFDSAGAILGLAIFYLLACVDWITDWVTGRGRAPDQSLASMAGQTVAYYLLALASCGVCLFVDKLILDKYGWSTYEIVVADFGLMWKTLYETPGNLAFFAIIVMSVILPLLMKIKTKAWLFVSYLWFTAFLTMAMPVASVGDTLPRKMALAKLMLLLGAGIRLGTLDNVWVARVAGFVAMFLAFSARIVNIREGMSKPLFS